MYVLNDSLLLDDISCNHPFFMVLSLTHGNIYVNGNVFISKYLLQPSIITIGLWLIQENSKDIVFV